MAHTTGLIRTNTAPLAERLRLIGKRPSYRLTGTRPSLRSVSVWRSTNSSSSSSSKKRPTLYTRWLRTKDIEAHHWVARNGRRWLVRRVPYNSVVTRKALMLSLMNVILELELEYLVTMKMSAILVIPELGLVLGVILITL